MVELQIRDFGKIQIELDYTNAPNTAKNFVYLASQGFYDGLTFHRIIKNFMIQGGDPLGDGTGGADYTIRGEFLANGFKNQLHHRILILHHPNFLFVMLMTIIWMVNMPLLEK